MRGGFRGVGMVTLIGSALLTSGLAYRCAAAGEEPSRFGRLFRFGSNSTPPPSNSAPPSAPTLMTAPPSTGTPALIPPPSTPTLPETEGASPRIIPQPRVSRAVTESDPILTRIAIGRSDNGSRFGMFIQVYADGTVLDGEGVHQVDRKTLKPLFDAIQSADVGRLRGHCGGPPTDFIEQVHMVVYDRSLGRLRANAFSFSGNTQGCDHSIQHIQAAVDAIQAKISGLPAPTTTTTPAPGALPASPTPTTPPGSVPPLAPPSGTGRTIPLTPLN